MRTIRTALVAVAILVCCVSQLFARQEITPPTFGSTVYQLSSPVVATNGQTFLTLWTVNTNLGGYHVYGSLADASGRLLTPVSFLVLPHATVQQLLASGSGYLAVVKDLNAGVTRTASLSSEGKLLSLSGRLPLTDTAPQGSALPASTRAINGGRMFSVGSLSNSVPAGETIGVVSNLDGTVVRQVALAKQSRFDVTASGTGFAVATTDDRVVMLRPFSRDGIEVASPVRIDQSRRYVHSVAVASIGQEVAVAWAETFLDRYTIHVAVVNAEGVIAGTSQFESRSLDLRLRSSGTSYVLLNDSKLFRVDRTGALTDGPLAVPGTSEIAVNESVVYAAQFQPYSVRPAVTSTTVALGSSLVAGNPVVLSIMLRRQVAPVLASDGVGFLAVWSDQTAESTNLAAMRLDQNGSPLDAAQIELGAGDGPFNDPSGSTGGTYACQVAFGRSIYLVIWQRGTELVMRRLDRSGNLLDSQPVVLANVRQRASIFIIPRFVLSNQSVTWTGSSFFATWGEGSGSPLRGVTVSESGVVSPVLDLGTGAPHLTWDGTRFLQATNELSPLICDHCSSLGGLSLRRIAADGTLIDKTPLFVPVSGTSRVATSGRELVIASDVVKSVEGRNEYSIEVRTVRADGPVLQVSAPTTVFQWTLPTVSGIVWNGTQYALTWKYGMGTVQFVGLQHLSRDLGSTDMLYTEETPDMYDPASLATDAAGQEIVAISEIATLGSVARIRTFAPSEMKLTPAAPPTTLITSALGTSQSTVVTWQVSPAAILSGFIIEASYSPGNSASTIAVLPPDARTATVWGSGYVGPQSLYVRMRTFNAGGISEPSASVHVVLPMRNRR